MLISSNFWGWASDNFGRRKVCKGLFVYKTSNYLTTETIIFLTLIFLIFQIFFQVLIWSTLGVFTFGLISAFSYTYTMILLLRGGVGASMAGTVQG